jgi:hypothetical protein
MKGFREESGMKEINEGECNKTTKREVKDGRPKGSRKGRIN